MSLSFQPLQPVKVIDPRVWVDRPREYAVLQSGKEVMYKAYTSTSISSASIQFSCPPPSGNVIVDRKMYISLPVRLTFTGPGTNTDNLLMPNRDAPRAFPFSSACDTLNVTINNTSVTMNMADVIHPLLRFNTKEDLKNFEYSGTTSCLDQSQNYSDLYGTVRNPLGFYGDSSDEDIQSRASYPFTIVSNTPTSAVVDMLITEPLFLSPFYWGKGNSSGFFNVNTMDFNFNFLNNCGMRMWSHDNSLGTNVISSITAEFNAFSPTFSYSPKIPQLLFTYISPQDTELPSSLKPITYPYYDITRYSTDIGTIAYSASNVGAGSDYSTNNIQLSTIPKRLYLFVRPANSVMYGNSGVNITDSFYGISNINVQFNNGLYLNSASQYQLYQLAVKNGCNLSWNQWSGNGLHKVGSFTEQKIAGVGSIICLEFGTDIPINSATEAPGVNGQYNLYVQCKVYNCDPSGAHDALNASIYMVVVSEGSFTIPALGQSMKQLGVLSRNDVLESKQQPGILYHDVYDYHGGDFLSGIKDFGNSILSGLKQAGPYILKGLEYASKIAPLLLAAGEDDINGGIVTGGVSMGGVSMGGVNVGGGRQLSRAELRKRLGRN